MPVGTPDEHGAVRQKLNISSIDRSTADVVVTDNLSTNVQREILAFCVGCFEMKRLHGNKTSAFQYTSRWCVGGAIASIGVSCLSENDLTFARSR